jgi:hypothetical protein
MKRAAVLAAALALGVASPAAAKTGLEWDTYPDTSDVGQPIAFTLHVYKPPPSSGGRAPPARGATPLLTFRSRSGRVVRVRVPAADRFGVAHGSVAFPDKGPWIMTFHEKVDGVWIGNEDSQPIHVGIGLTQTTPAADAGSAGHASPWVWILSFATIGAAALVFLMRRRGRWGAA